MSWCRLAMRASRLRALLAVLWLVALPSCREVLNPQGEDPAIHRTGGLPGSDTAQQPGADPASPVNGDVGQAPQQDEAPVPGVPPLMSDDPVDPNAPPALDAGVPDANATDAGREVSSTEISSSVDHFDAGVDAAASDE